MVPYMELNYNDMELNYNGSLDGALYGIEL